MHVLTDDRKVGAATVEGQVIVFTISLDRIVVSAEVVHSAFTISRKEIVVSAALTFGVILTTNIVAKNAERDGCAVCSDYCRL